MFMKKREEEKKTRATTSPAHKKETKEPVLLLSYFLALSNIYTTQPDANRRDDNVSPRHHKADVNYATLIEGRQRGER